MKDHRLDIYVDAVTYMALKRRCDDVSRSISQHVRHLIRQDMEEALQQELDSTRAARAGAGGESLRDD